MKKVTIVFEDDDLYTALKVQAARWNRPLKALVASRMDTFAVHILAPEEVEPELTGDFLLVDSETGERLDVTASRRLVENYQKTVRGFCSSLQQFCAQRGITYLFASTDLPFEALVLNYLRSVGLVR